MGCRIYYEHSIHTNPQAPTVLLLHGWGCDHSIFSTIAERLAQKATLITLDFPGHGASGEPPEPWGVREYAVMVKLLLEALNQTSVHIIAHSFGGRIALVLASSYPALVQRFIITGGAGIRRPTNDTESIRTKRYKRYSRLLSKVEALPALGKLAKWGREKLRNHYGSADYVKLNERMRATFVKVVNEDLSPLLPDIHASTLLIWGDQDTETPLWMGQEMEKEIPDAGLVVFEGKGHYAFLEDWQRFTLIAENFLLEGQN